MELDDLGRVITGLLAPILAWAREIDTNLALLNLVVLAVVIVFRAPLSRALMAGAAKVLKALSIDLNEAARKRMAATTRVLLVTTVMLAMLESLSPPEFAGSVLRRLILSVIVIAVFSALHRMIGPLVSLINPEKFDEVTVNSTWMERLSQFVIVLMGVTALLAVWDIDIGSALTGVGVLGAGLAIAAQDFIRNLVAGMNNMSEKRFKVGDWICVDGVIEGVVSDVDVRSTTVMGFDRVPRYVPNADLSNAIVLNKTRMDHRKIVWIVPLTWDSTDAQVAQVCAQLRAHLHESGDFVVAADVLLMVHAIGLSKNAIEVQIFGFTCTKAYEEYLNVCARLTAAVRGAVADAGASVAYPTQSVHLDVHRGGAPDI